MRFEIIVDINGVKWSLDAYKEEPISLTYNVADIADIAARNSSFSKTIKLPETANNRQAFGDISDLAAEPATFNPNKKAKCWILVDTLPVIEGYLQLRKVYLNRSTQMGELEVVIYADNDNFYKLLGDSNLTDLNFSELNHDWTAANIVQSWTASWNNGYYYPLIDYGQDWELGDINGWSTAYKTYVSTGEMFPATNVKYIWDKIFANANYSYQSNFLNGDMFKDLYIPFNKAKITRDVNTASDRFTIGFTQSRSATAGTTASFSVRQLQPSTTLPQYIQQPGPYGPQSAPNTLSYKMFQGKIPFTDEASPNGDPDNLYNTTTFDYVAPSNFPASSFTCNFDITFPAIPTGQGSAGYGTTTTYTPFQPNIWIAFKRSRNPVTGATVSPTTDNPLGGQVIPIGGSVFPKRFLAAEIPNIQYSNGSTLNGFRTVKGQITTDILTDNSAVHTRKLYPGEKVWVEVQYSCPMNRLVSAGVVTVNSPNPPGTFGTLAAGKTLITFGGTNRLWNNLTPVVNSNEQISYNSIIPSNIKQKDFVSSIIKMFNLIVEPSKDYEKTLIIEPRDDYYATGEIKDWTYKLDISQAIEEQILGETQNKKTILKYKDDKDFYNEDYKTITGDINYGEYDYYIDNDFISGEKKVEPIFSPTPIIGIYNNNTATKFAIPKIVKARQTQPQDFTDHNIRILTRFSSSTNNTWVYGDYQWRNGGAYNAYTQLTSQGFGNAIHSFNVGDYIQVRQNDNGVLKPMLQANFQVLEVVNNKTIVIDIPFDQVGSGAAVGGTVTPLKGLVGLDENLTWQFESTRFRAYPYLGHYDHPQLPSYDINFGQIVGAYYPQSYTTNDNLYEMYWSNMLNEISDSDSRIIKANFYLTAADIANFKFNDKIYINNQYYKINKIEGYDPTMEKLTKVELIKTKFITIPRKSIRRPWWWNISGINIGESVNTTIRDISLRPGSLTTPRNNVYASGAVVTGRDNNVSGRSIVVGNGNTISSEGTSVIGNNNQIEAAVSKSSVVGDNNLLLQNSTDTQSKFVFGSGNTHSGIGFVYGDNNSIDNNTKNTHLFGSNNIITRPYQSGESFSSVTTERVFIIGDYNTISNPTFSAIKDIFIQGTNSNIQSNNATVFGSNVNVGYTASNSIVMADNVNMYDNNTIYMAKDRTKIVSPYTQIVSTASIAGPRLDVSSTLTNVSSVSNFSGNTNFTAPVLVTSTFSNVGNSTFTGDVTANGNVEILGDNTTISSGTVSVLGGGVNINATTYSVAAKDTIFLGTASFNSRSFSIIATTYSVSSPSQTISGTISYANGTFEVNTKSRFQVTAGTVSISSTQSTSLGGPTITVSATQSYFNTMTIFASRATFSSTTAVTGNFQATGVVNLSGSNTYISNLQSSTNLNSYFA